MAIDDIKLVFAGTNNDSKKKIINEYYHLMINDRSAKVDIIAENSDATDESKKKVIISYINTIKNYLPSTWAKYCAKAMKQDIVMVTDSGSVTYPGESNEKKDPIYVYYDGLSHFSRILTNKQDDMNIYGTIKKEHIIGFYDPKLRQLLGMQNTFYDKIGIEVKKQDNEDNIGYLDRISDVDDIIKKANNDLFKGDNPLLCGYVNNNKINSAHKKWIEEIKNKIIELIVEESSNEGISKYLSLTKIDEKIIIKRIETMLLPKNIVSYSINKCKEEYLEKYIKQKNVGTCSLG